MITLLILIALSAIYPVHPVSSESPYQITLQNQFFRMVFREDPFFSLDTIEFNGSVVYRTTIQPIFRICIMNEDDQVECLDATSVSSYSYRLSKDRDREV